MKTFDFYAINNSGFRVLISIKEITQKQAIKQAKIKAKQRNLVLIF